MEVDLASGLVPLFLCTTIGTTALGAVDSLEGLEQVAKDYKVWFHVDAAYRGSACICPEFRQYLNGIELVDSISMNPHKWFLTNMDCCCLWVKNPSTLVDSLSTSLEILSNKATESKKVVDYKDWQIALSRRFRALKLWLVIRRYGVANLMEDIRSDIRLAKKFEGLVTEDERFQVVVPRKFVLVCFRLKPRRSEEDGSGRTEVLEEVNSSGKAFMTHAVVDRTFLICCAIGGTFTEERHIDGLWKLIQEKAADLLLFKNGCNIEE
ncbi:Tryptophan decarboxylase TDC1 [Camellia lanceoleosa]|uniref:Tryptophan decarboxylase TDC1 n=1 Tax=Camellia lanceoleosa TaxID=1840588 RepID=A0ACC0GZG8_9ERIC|nr:Tryptophan decarboxylase TDC1 [Camellia lanceoleosa]